MGGTANIIVIAALFKNFMFVCLALCGTRRGPLECVFNCSQEVCFTSLAIFNLDSKHSFFSYVNKTKLKFIEEL